MQTDYKDLSDLPDFLTLKKMATDTRSAQIMYNGQYWVFIN